VGPYTRSCGIPRKLAKREESKGWKVLRDPYNENRLGVRTAVGFQLKERNRRKMDIKEDRMTNKATAPAQGIEIKPLEDTRPRIAHARSKSVSQQEIQLRAYEKWEAVGKPIGKDLKFWLEAQHELLRGK
jgi:hypothetical protein